MTMHISELPANVFSKIASCYVGASEYVKLNHNKDLNTKANKRESTTINTNGALRKLIQ